jgi:4-hydroxybenzoate polyprenyltransferase
MVVSTTLFWLSRPRFACWLLWIPFIGYGFALWDRALDWTRPGALLLVLVGWLSLNAGTMWLNAALDAHERGALWLSRVELPNGLAIYAAAALCLGVVAAAVADVRSGLCAAGCALLAVLYSHPRTAWKGNSVLGPLVNTVGYGLLSPLAGWYVADVDLNLRTAVTFALLALWILGVTFASQAFQREDDALAGHRTLVVTHGPAACLRVGRACVDVAVLGVMLLSAFGYYPRAVLLAVPMFWIADRHLRRWQRQPDGGGPEWVAGLVARMLAGGAVIFLLVWADYLLSP